MDKPVLNLYRKRFIPEELVHLKDDNILFVNSDIIVTEWKTLKKRTDFACGCSAYYIKEGLKISKFLNSRHELCYYYVDIVDYEWNGSTLIVSDLLADILIYPDKSVKVLDLGEIPEAVDLGLIDTGVAMLALKRLDNILNIIYAGGFGKLCEPIDKNYN